MHVHPNLRWGDIVFATFLCISTAQANGDEPVLSPDRAVALALAAHPYLQSARAEVDTSRAARSASGVLLANPSTTASFTPDGRRAEIGITQPLSLTGEGWHVRAAAGHGLDAAESTLDRRKREVAASVRRAYVDAVVAAGLVEVAQDGSDLATRLRHGIERKLEEGEASTLDLRLARLSDVQASARLLEARREEVIALRALAKWILTPVETGDLAEDPLVAAPTLTASDDHTRSDIVAAEAALDQARAELRRARSATFPTLTAGMNIEIDGGETFVGPSVGLTLPIFTFNQVARSRARGAVDVAEGRMVSVRSVAETEKRTSSTRVTEAELAATSTEATDLDEAREALRSIEAGVRAGQIDLPTAVLLQTQVLAGEAAVVSLRGLLADARIDRLLALDDEALLGGAP